MLKTELVCWQVEETCDVMKMRKSCVLNVKVANTPLHLTMQTNASLATEKSDIYGNNPQETTIYPSKILFEDGEKGSCFMFIKAIK